MRLGLPFPVQPREAVAVSYTPLERSGITLNGSASRDPDAGDTLSWLWKRTDTSRHTVTLWDADTASPSLTAPSTLSGSSTLVGRPRRCYLSMTSAVLP